MAIGVIIVVAVVAAVLAVGAVSFVAFTFGYRTGRRSTMPAETASDPTAESTGHAARFPASESDPSCAPSAAERQSGWGAQWPDLLHDADIRHLVDMLPVNVFFKDQSGKLIRVNRALVEATGIPQEQWVGQTTMDLTAENEEKHRRDDQYVFNTGQPCLNIIDSYRGVDGTHWARTDKLPLTSRDGEVVGLVGISVDITEQVHAEQKLEAERQLIADLLNVLPIGICVNDEEGRYVLVNEAYCATYNFKRDEMLGQHFSAIMPPDQVKIAEGHYEQLLGGDLGIPQERKRQRSDGSIIHIEAANGLLVRSDGRKYVTTVVRDITPRKQAELEREQVIQDLNAYAHMVAHDLKNPVAVILGFAAVLREDVKSLSDEDFDISVDAIESAAHKMLAIIDELMLLAQVRRENVKLEPVDMGLVVQSTQERLSWLIASSEPEIIVPEEWPLVIGYAPWIEEVWTNYISNAIKYGGTPPRVELGVTPLDETARFWVRDNGQGIPADQLDKLFTPFTRLDQLSTIEGHGLGLSIVQRVVEQLGGVVSVESEVGQGSTFSFTLPRVS